MPRPKKYSDELRERAVRLVFESQRPIAHFARDLGVHKEALRLWVRQTEADGDAALLPHRTWRELLFATSSVLDPAAFVSVASAACQLGRHGLDIPRHSRQLLLRRHGAELRLELSESPGSSSAFSSFCRAVGRPRVSAHGVRWSHHHAIVGYGSGAVRVSLGVSTRVTV
jgi:transposase